MPKKNIPEEKRSYIHEIVGISVLTLGIFLFVCLLSYSPQDPSLNSSGDNGSVRNYGGVVGSFLANFLISSLGLASFAVGALFILASYLCFTKKHRRLRWPQAVLLLVFLFSLSIFFHLQWDRLTLYGKNILAGGLIGHLVGEQLRRYLSEVGSYLLVGTLGLLTFIWATQVSFIEFLQKFSQVVKRLGLKLIAFLRLNYGRLKKALRKWSHTREQKRKSQQEAPKKAPKINLRSSEDPAPKTPKLRVLNGQGPTQNRSEEPKIIKMVEKKSPKKSSEQLSFGKMNGEFQLPPLGLLDPVPVNSHKNVDESMLKSSSVLLEKKLQDYNVEGRVTEIHPGPVVTMYEFEPAAGVKINKITNLADDLSLSMGGRPVRIVAPLPGKPAVGIEIPNTDRETVFFKEIVTDQNFQKSTDSLILALGKNIEGAPVVANLAKMPHLLVAGATGAGKSVGLNSFILSLLLKNTPEEVRFIFIDPKMLELSIYANIPHLLLPVVTQPKKATLALAWAVKEMERRYKLLSDAQVRNIHSYNKKIEDGYFKDHKPKPVIEGSDEDPIVHEEKLPYLVIIIDELADLMMVSGREVEEYITRLAQMARAAGIHMILATQRPSVDVITGIIKANFPSRIAFKVTSKHDSRTILDSIGAEQLLGSGDMLFIPPGLSKQTRVHGAFVSDQEIQRVVKHLKEQAKPIYNEEIMNMKVATDVGGPDAQENDELYDQAVSIVTETRQASISMVQRRLRIGYNRAARLIEQMEAEGIVSAPMGSKGREVLARGYGTEG